MNTYHATKYDSAASEVIAILSSVTEGYGIGETGDVESPTGYFSLVVLDDECAADFEDRTHYPIGDYAGEVAREYGVTADDVKGTYIVTTNSQGFVSVELFSTPESAWREYHMREDAFSEWDASRHVR